MTISTEVDSHTRMAAEFLREVITLKQPIGKSTIFPWLSGLDEEEQKEFLDEFVDICACTNLRHVNLPPW